MTPADNILLQRIDAALGHRPDTEVATFLARNATPDVWTGDRIKAASDAMARDLRQWLGQGDHTLVLAMPAGSDFYISLLACLRAGITAVPVTLPRIGSHSDRFQHLVSDSGASAVLCTPDAQKVVTAALSVMEAPPCPVVALPLADLPPVAGRAGAPDASPPVIVQYTSGSTRNPKGVRLTAAGIVANCDTVMREWQMDAATRMVNWLPHYHDMGLMGGVLYPLLCGGVSFQMSPMEFIRRPIFWLQAISDHRANFSGGPAFAFSDCVRRIEAKDLAGVDLSSWRRAFCGAEPVPTGLLDAFHAHLASTGLPRASVFPCYGMAEITLFSAGSPEAAETPDTRAMGVEPCKLTAGTAPNIRIVDPGTSRARRRWRSR